MLKIKDLAVSKELDSKAMGAVVGGWKRHRHPMLDLDFSTHLDNKVADVDQVFAFNFAQGNAGEVINNQAIQGGNGTTRAPVTQSLHQDNTMKVYDLGNTFIR